MFSGGFPALHVAWVSKALFGMMKMWITHRPVVSCGQGNQSRRMVLPVPQTQVEDVEVMRFPRLVAQSRAAGGGYGSVSTPREALTVVAAVPVRTAVLTVKRGKVIIRSAAVHRTNGNCDVFVDLTLMDRRLFTTTEEDGRSAAIQEQIMSHEMQTLVLNCKNVIRHRLADMRQDPCVGVVIQSHCGKHRSVAVAEFLAKACEAFADVTLFHMEVHRWDSNYAEAPRDERPAPKHSLVIRPGSTGNV